MECKQSSRNGSSLSYDTCDGRAGYVVEKWKRHLSLNQAVDPLVPCRFVEGFWRDRNLETFWKMTFVQKFSLPFFLGGLVFSQESCEKFRGLGVDYAFLPKQLKEVVKAHIKCAKSDVVRVAYCRQLATDQRKVDLTKWRIIIADPATSSKNSIYTYTYQYHYTSYLVLGRGVG